jgi:hypothetical protein
VLEKSGNPVLHFFQLGKKMHKSEKNVCFKFSFLYFICRKKLGKNLLKDAAAAGMDG